MAIVKQRYILFFFAAILMTAMHGCQRDNGHSTHTSSSSSAPKGTPTQAPTVDKAVTPTNLSEKVPPVDAQATSPEKKSPVKETDTTTKFECAQRPPRYQVFGPETASLVGLPAISADNRTIVVEKDFESLSDASLVALAFIDIATGNEQETVVLYEAAADGKEVTQSYARPKQTLWRRAKSINERLQTGEYCPMILLDSVDEKNPRIAHTFGAMNLNVSETNLGRLVVRDTRIGKRLVRRHLAEDTYFCGMESGASYVKRTNLTGAWVDAERTTLLIQHGFEYASCMCPNLVRYQPISLR